MSVHQRKRDKRYFVVWWEPGRQQRKKLFGPGREGKREAQAFDYEIKRRKKTGDVLPDYSGRGIHLDELSQLWLNEKVSQGRALGWLTTWADILQKYILPTLAQKPVDELAYDEIIEFMAGRYATAAQATRNRYLSYLKGIFQFGVEHGHCKSNPLARWKKPRERPRQTLLTVADFRKIMQHAAPHLAWAMEVEYHLGTRAGVSELLTLNWNMIDWDQAHIRVYGKKTRTWRTIPIPSDFLARLKEKQEQATTPYIIEYRGAPVKKFRRSLSTACDKAKIGYKVVMTDIRHLFATTLLQGGADLAAVSALMGHSSTKMTADQYYHLHASEKRRAVELLPSLAVDNAPPKKQANISKAGGNT